MSSSLFAAQGLLSRHNVPEGSFLVFAGIFSPVLVGLSSSFIAGGLLPCDGKLLQSRCGGVLGVPLKL